MTQIRIAECSVNATDSAEDTASWKFSPSGQFSMRSAYGLMLVHDSNPVGWGGVESDFETKVQQRVKVFQWLVALERIMANNARCRRSLADNPSCLMCDAPNGEHATCIEGLHGGKASLDKTCLIGIRAEILLPEYQRLAGLKSDRQCLYTMSSSRLEPGVCPDLLEYLEVADWFCIWARFRNKTISINDKLIHLERSLVEVAGVWARLQDLRRTNQFRRTEFIG